MHYHPTSQPVDETTKQLLAEKGKITLEFNPDAPYGEVTAYLQRNFPWPLYRWGFRRVGLSRRSVNVIESLATLNRKP